MIQEVGARYLETLLNHLGSELIGTILSSEAKNMLDGTALVSRTAVLANVLDAPVTELTVRDDVDASEDFVDTGTLKLC